ncbi:tetratricopeptide repeat protein, partial [Planktomarina temperata]|nr:tetratricopeptide repeat protein [Planktomarina temperata]
TLKDQGKLDEAIEAYKKALAIKPDYADAYNNMGNALKDQGKLEEAIEAYNKALAIKPDYAEAYNNMGIALKDKGKLEEAIKAYNKALAIKPDYTEAYNNLGATLQDQGKLEEAIKAYNNALAIKPDFADAHRLLSLLTKYTPDTAQISDVEALLQQIDINDSDRCNLLYTNAKMQEDLGDLSAAYASYVAGGGLRQKLLKYEFTQDEHLFDQIKRIAPKFKDVALSAASEPITHTPIFILGMPRSGTTLVEQIASSHSEVAGAGELKYVSLFGGQLAAGLTAPTLEAVSTFRERYLAELAKRAEGQPFVTDKMPQNFLYIALICAALPEAKIVHVQRSAEATCWSNFMHYFVLKGLGYSYNLGDTVKYYKLYKDLMHFWYQSYSDRIYNLDYDRLTEDQAPKTRRLIAYLGLNWEDACLAPEKNKRSVRTASQQQVRQKVYKGSSQAWRKYEPFLDGVFDELNA